MTRVRDDERGQVIVLAAVMIPVFLLIAALALDVGNWYTHKRQLQNRADAAAFAAGFNTRRLGLLLGRRRNEARCRESHRRRRAAVRRRPFESGDRCTTPRSLSQSRVDLEINSPTHTAAPSNPTRAGTIRPEPASGPATSTRRTHIQPTARTTSMSESESATSRRFSACSDSTSSATSPRSRRVVPAAAGKGFLPLALPDQNILQAQIRYYQECGPGSPVLLTKESLNPLDSATRRRNDLWGKTIGDLPGRCPAGIPTDIRLNMPESTDCPATTSRSAPRCGSRACLRP